ncbi:MAG TPA: aminodeoxychorismate lyase [Rhodanobacteraceae bacterium]|nr:aminodeoxychorismate lyase [Rhodanobacteraceae bacterium]
MARVLVNGAADDRVSALDRGLAYGDGVFETIRWRNGVAPLWSRHLARLREGCARLGLARPDPAVLARDAAEVVGDERDAVVKIIVTRGPAERGYAPVADRPVTRIVAAFPTPDLPAAWYVEGIRVRCCDLRLAAQPALAGIKHLNRLEQVLARAEWTDATLVEGLLFDQADHLVSATAANVFVASGGRLLTPALTACGVAGVMRAALLDALPATAIRAIGRDELTHADEVFLTSSVRGVLPVRAIDGRAYRVGALARAAQACWHGLGFDGGPT